MGFMKIGSVNDLKNVPQIHWGVLQNYYWFDICNGTISRVSVKNTQIGIQRKLLWRIKILSTTL